MKTYIIYNQFAKKSSVANAIKNETMWLQECGHSVFLNKAASIKALAFDYYFKTCDMVILHFSEFYELFDIFCIIPKRARVIVYLHNIEEQSVSKETLRQIGNITNADFCFCETEQSLKLLQDSNVDIYAKVVPTDNKENHFKYLINKHKKINLLFEANIFIGLFYKSAGGRSGLFFCAYNILKKLSENPIFNISLYFDYNLTSISMLQKIKQEPFFNNFNRITLQDIAENKDSFFGVDVFFSPVFALPKEAQENKFMKNFMMLHDTIPLIFEENYLSDTRNYNEWFYKLAMSLNKNTYYFCNSLATKNDFLKYFPQKIDELKMSVIYHGPQQNFVPLYDANKLISVLKKYGVNHVNKNKYIISICSIEPKKNIPFTLKCFAAFIKKHNIEDLYFYLGGGIWNDYESVFTKTLQDCGQTAKKIFRLGFIDEDDVNVLYSNALFFTFISKYEGFGVPLLEAMQAGVPVLTSDNSSIPEVVGDAAIKINCNSEDQCIKAFEDLYFNEDLRKCYIEKGIIQAELFSWDKCVAEMSEKIITISTKN
ncbi:MAG: hypothetical protein Ta2B_21240 [Termitinemataceae bacterium]|nr:MAG: hypothetical protein Ta2B_21240 [Termitinemataceae bacterium]